MQLEPPKTCTNQGRLGVAHNCTYWAWSITCTLRTFGPVPRGVTGSNRMPMSQFEPLCLHPSPLATIGEQEMLQGPLKQRGVVHPRTCAVSHDHLKAPCGTCHATAPPLYTDAPRRVGMPCVTPLHHLFTLMHREELVCLVWLYPVTAHIVQALHQARLYIESRAVVNGEKKKVFRYQFSQKSPRALHVFNHGWWRLAVGAWWRLAVSNLRLAAVGGW